jgi:PAS domain S-box-containing protein
MKKSSGTTSTRPLRKAMLDIDLLPLPYVEIDANGIITRVNNATVALHHPLHGELVGKSGWDLLAIDEKDRSSAAFHALMVSGEEPPVIHHSIFDRSGKFRTYEMHRRLIRNGRKKAAGIRMICIDVTEAKRDLEEAQRARQWLESAMLSLAEAVILTDALGLIHSVNPAAEKLCSRSAVALKAMAIDELLSVEPRPGENGATLDLQTMLQIPVKGIATVKASERRPVKVEFSTSPIFEKDSGSVSGVTALLRQLENVA